MNGTDRPLRLAPAFLLGLALLAGCSDEQAANEPYVEFAGGGFIFNYRLAEAYYGFVAKVRRAIPEGTILEASFENPAGGPPLIVAKTARAGFFQYAFETPSLQGVVADRDYQVELRLLDPADRHQLASYRKSFRSTMGQDVLPKRPLTIGPGYQRNPADAGAEQPQAR
jgi:hypothetical protein